MSAPAGPWRPQPAGTGLAIVAIAALAAGLVFGRADVAVLGAPLAAVAVLALRRPTGSADVSVTVQEAGSGAIRGTVAVAAPSDAELVVVRAAAYEEKPTAVVVSPARARALVARLPVLHSGPQQVLLVAARLLASGGGSLLDVDPVVARATVAPPPEPVGSLLLPPVLSGRPGGHPARRLGDGSDFRDLHPFTPGDRLRRIDWRATARVGGAGDELIVRRTEAVSEATAVVVLDSRDDVGTRVAEWSRDRPARKGIGSLDLARSAIGGIAAAYLEAGDRVAFHDLVHRGGSVRTGAGRRQLERIRAVAAETVARPGGLPRTPVMPARSIVYLLSTFLDDEIARLAALWRGGDHRVVAVDLLPRPDLDGVEEPQALAYAILRLEHANRLDRLRALGVQVIRWDDPERDVVLRQASRTRGRR